MCPNKIIDTNSTINNIVTGIIETKSLVKHISCDFKSRFPNKLWFESKVEALCWQSYNIWVGVLICK